MKAAVYHGIRQMTIEDIPEPVPGAEDIVMKVKSCGICGSDVHTYNAGWYGCPGQVMGHEFGGEVTAVGNKVSDIKVGDRLCGLAIVPCRTCASCRRGEANLCEGLFSGTSIDGAIGYGSALGAFAELVKVPRAQLGFTVFSIPASLNFEDGALVEPLSVGYRATVLGASQPGDRVVVLGAGQIGLGIIQFLRARGAGLIVSVEVKKARQAAAKACGADLVLDPREGNVSELIAKACGKSRKPDIVFECAGVPATFDMSVDLVRPGGTVVMVAMHEKPSSFVPSRIVEKGITVFGSCGYKLGPDSEAVLRLLEKGIIQSPPMISHRFPLDQAVRAFDCISSDESAVKVLVG